MKKLFYLVLSWIAVTAIAVGGAASTTSCSSPEQDSIRAAKAKADSLASIKDQLVPGYKLSELGSIVDILEFYTVSVKGVCAPNRVVLYFCADSVSYETNVATENDSAWTNVVAFDPATMAVQFGPDAEIVSVIEKPLSDVQEVVNAKYDEEVAAATECAKKAADTAIYYENCIEGDGQVRLGEVEPVDLQAGTFRYQAQYYYPGGRGWIYHSSRWKNIKVKRDGDTFTTK